LVYQIATYTEKIRVKIQPESDRPIVEPNIGGYIPVCDYVGRSGPSNWYSRLKKNEAGMF
jgi:hypothetical protein